MSLFDRQKVVEIRQWAKDAIAAFHEVEDELENELFFQDIIDLCNGYLLPLVPDEEEQATIAELKKELDKALNDLADISDISRHY